MKISYMIFLVSVVAVLGLAIISIDPLTINGTTNGNVRFFTENNFTLNYGTEGGDIIPFSRQIIYDSESNNLTTTFTLLTGNTTSKTIQISDEQERALIDTIVSTDYASSFNSDTCNFPDCGLAHLTINVENENFTNSFVWSNQSSETLQGLFGIQEKLNSLVPNNNASVAK